MYGGLILSDSKLKLSPLGILVNIPLEERIESLETAVKQKTVINDSILELIYMNSRRIDEVEKKLDAILKEMKTFNETNAH